MIYEPEVSVTSSMAEEGLVSVLDDATVDSFSVGEGLQLLFFTGGKSVRRESHDVAVALRELLRKYQGMLPTGVLEGDSTPAMLSKYRVAELPCLAFIAGGEVLEVVPRVRDWAEYADVFRRYLGSAPRQVAGAA